MNDNGGIKLNSDIDPKSHILLGRFYEKERERMKLYIAKEGYFGTNWEFINEKVFKTKKALHKYMKDTLGFGCPKSYRSCYGKDEDIYENNTQEYGYEVVEVSLFG